MTPERALAIEQRKNTGYAIELVDSAQLEPNMLVITYKYTSPPIGSLGACTTIRWTSFVNDRTLASGVLWTSWDED